MVAPQAETIFGRDQRVVGIILACPECPTPWVPLRVETARDHTYPVPELAGEPGPLGFILRCDVCGFRVEMKGNRLPTVAMLREEVADDA